MSLKLKLGLVRLGLGVTKVQKLKKMKKKNCPSLDSNLGLLDDRFYMIWSMDSMYIHHAYCVFEVY